jgi:nondiscriminating glutamyl-tRNA synthetase
VGDHAVRVRFAPAPTGYLHVGGARTALYDWLFARHLGGTFVLRIEDTDQTRSTHESVAGLQDALTWLGIDWDEGPEVGGPFGPYRQTERLGIYQDQTDRLLADGNAYRCWCTQEELEERRKAVLARGKPWRYDRKCLNRTEEERRELEAEGRTAAVRFKAPSRDVVVPDEIRGDARFPAADIDDFVIMRSTGFPTYLLAAAVDDWKMEMTHVIRGEDLHSSTPRQILLLEALGAERIPAYAHLPLIVGPDRQPLSKRHGSVAVEWFRDRGYLPEALVNYLALLGWSYDDHTELFSRDDLVKHFDLRRVSRNPAMFDQEKLDWMNGHYVREADPDRLASLLVDRLTEMGVEVDVAVVREATPLVQERSRTLDEAATMLRFLFQDLEPNEKARKLLDGQEEYLAQVAGRLEALEEWRVDDIRETLESMAQERGLSKTKAFQPVRAAVTFSNVSPPLFESLAVLGRERSLDRLRRVAGADRR